MIQIRGSFYRVSQHIYFIHQRIGDKVIDLRIMRYPYYRAVSSFVMQGDLLLLFYILMIPDAGDIYFLFQRIRFITQYSKAGST